MTRNIGKNAASAKVGDFVVREIWTLDICEDGTESDALIRSQQEDGSWADIDYLSTDGSYWPSIEHLSRVRILSAQPQPQSESVRVACEKALTFWYAEARSNPNWWWNEIGVPHELGRIALNLGNGISAETKEKVLTTLRTCKITRTGQNRVWLAECVLLRGQIENDDGTIKLARQTLIDEIAVSDTVEGIQNDWSFHQHGNMPQVGNYGVAFLFTMSRLASELSATAYAFPKETVEILRNLCRHGFLPLIWAGRMDVGGLGRQFSSGVQQYKARAVEMAAQWLGVTEPAPSGLTFFGRRAAAAYRTNRWMVSFKAETKTIAGTETINGDNLLGAHFADGAMFTYVTGREYEDIFPCWNWRHIPGITTYDVPSVEWKSADGSQKPRNQSERFVRQGESRLSFSLDRDGLRANAEWTCTADGVKVRVSGICSEAELPVVTTVEQSVAQPNARWWREGKGIIAVNGGIRYELPSEAIVTIGPRLGEWKQVMSSMSDRAVGVRVFEVVIPHGRAPKQTSCGWTLRFPKQDTGVARPLVSVVVPVYNVEKYLGACLDSILAQTYPNLEVICVNDGSTDGSSQILEDYRSRFGPERVFHVITQKNAGLSAARNAGMDQAVGKYIYFLDSDDMIVPEAIESLVNLAEINALDQIIFNCRITVEGNDPTLLEDAERKARLYYQVPAEINCRIVSGDDLFAELVNRKSFYATQQMRFYRRSVLADNRLRYPDGLVHEDNFMAPLSLFFAGRAMIVDGRWLVRRFRHNSIVTTTGDMTCRRDSILRVALGLCADERLWKNDRRQFRRALGSFIRSLLAYRSSLAERNEADDVDALFLGLIPRPEYYEAGKLLLSIVVPVFNAGKFLRKCMDSLLCASSCIGCNVEFVCVDDGSSDDSLEILEEYAKSDSRFRILRQHNEGAGKARNAGLDVAKGEYLFFCDADDWVDPDIFVRLLDAACESDAELTACTRKLIRDDGTSTVSGFYGKVNDIIKDGRIVVGPDDISDTIFSFATQVLWNKLFRRCHVQELGIRFQEILRANDVYFTCMALAHARRIALVDKPLYNYHINEGSISRVDSLANCCGQAFAAVRGRLIADGLYDRFADSFAAMTYSGYRFYFKMFSSSLELSRQYPRMRKKLLELTPDGLGNSSLINSYYRAEYDILRQNDSPLAIMLQFVKESMECESRIIGECQKQRTLTAKLKADIVADNREKSALCAKVDELRGYLERKDVAIAAKDAALDQLRGVTSQLKGNIDKQREAIAAKDAALDQLRGVTLQLKGIIDRQCEAIAAKDAALDRLRGVTSQLKGNVDKQREAIAAKDAALDQLRGVTAQLKGNIDKQREAIAAKDVALDQLRGVTSQLKGNIDKQREAIAAKDAALDQLRGVTSQLKGNIDKQREAIAAKDAALDQLRGVTSQLKGNIDKQREAIVAKDAALDQLRTVTAQLRGNVEKQREAIAAKDSMVAAQASSLVFLRADNAKKKNLLEQCQQTISELKGVVEL